MLLLCEKDFLMESGEVCFKKGVIYEFEWTDIYNGTATFTTLCDANGSIHSMDIEDLENFRKVTIAKKDV